MARLGSPLPGSYVARAHSWRPQGVPSLSPRYRRADVWPGTVRTGPTVAIADIGTPQEDA